MVDASVGVSWAVPSQSSSAAEALLEEVASGKPFVVPGLWMFEIANALLVLTRRKRIPPRQCARARAALSRLHPVIDDDGPRLALPPDLGTGRGIFAIYIRCRLPGTGPTERFAAGVPRHRTARSRGEMRHPNFILTSLQLWLAVDQQVLNLEL